MTNADVDKLVAGYQAGRSLPELGDEFGVHHRTVAAHLEQRGVKRRVNIRKLSDDDMRQAVRHYEAGDSLAIVAKMLGVNAETVRRAFVRAGINIRPRCGVTSRHIE